MTKRLINWKNINCKVGRKTESRSVANDIDGYYRGTLLSRILEMEKKTPISLEAAIHLMMEHEDKASAAGRKGTEPGHLFWYSWHFVEWLAQLGYHIELSGDEFEPYVMAIQVA